MPKQVQAMKTIHLLLGDTEKEKQTVTENF